MPWSCHLRGSIVMHVWEPFLSEYLSDLSHADCVRATVFTQQRCDDHKTSFPLEMDFFTGNGGQYNCQWTSYNKQTNKQTDNNLLYWSVLSKETMSKCSKHYNETTCLQLVVPSDTWVLNISSSFNSPHKLRRVQTQENSCWFVKWPINYGIHQVPL